MKLAVAHRIKDADRSYPDLCRQALGRIHMMDPRNIAQHVAFAAAESTAPAAPESVHYPDSDGHFLPPTPL